MGYVESLQIPHPRKTDQTEDPVPLVDHLALDAMRSLAGRDGTDQQSLYPDAAIVRAREIAQGVSRALWFPIRERGRDDFEEMGLSYPLPLEAMTEKQAANCFGYTVATSECLERAGIENWIGYANGHAFNIVPSDADDKSLYFLDSLSMNLSQPLDPLLVRGNEASIRREYAEHGRAAVMLDSARLAANAGEPIDSLAGRHPWLVFDNKNGLRPADRYMGVDGEHELMKYRSRYNLIASVFPSDKGRQAISDYVDLRCAMTNGDIDLACASLENLCGTFPEIDARQNHEELSRLVDGLCRQGDSGAAMELVHRYFDSNFSLSRDSRLPEAKGDMLRKVARLTGDRQAAEAAKAAYEEAYRRPRSFKEALLGKVAAAHSLAVSLLDAPAST
jgi:hypothetical protein